MNYYQPRQREHDKRWDMTCMNDGQIWPVGYCRRFHGLEDDPMVSPTVAAEYRATEHKHHVTGHDTPEEARACYREYLLDHHLRLMEEHSDEQRKCVVCGVWTTYSATCNHLEHFDLCPEHNNREEVAKLVGPVGDIISSW